MPLPGLSDRRTQAWAAQGLGGVVLAAVLALLASTLMDNLARLNLTPGFEFLLRPAGMRMGESVLPFEPTDSFAWAILAAAVNTIRVSAAAIVLATVLGVAVGVMRLGSNPLLRSITSAYVELFRNTPLLLQILFWSAILLKLPPIRDAISLHDWAFLSNRGLRLPAITLQGGFGIEYPVRRLLGYQGGITLTPEFCALLLGLVAYHGTFIAEIVRGGILAVPRGQWEAWGPPGGRPHGAILRRIVLPQALRVILPSMTTQYVGILKNSSLAIAIGYPDLFWAVSTAINVTGHAIEGVAALMAGYLVLTLGMSGAMGLWYARMLRRGAR